MDVDVVVVVVVDVDGDVDLNVLPTLDVAATHAGDVLNQLGAQDDVKGGDQVHVHVAVNDAVNVNADV